MGAATAWFLAVKNPPTVLCRNHGFLTGICLASQLQATSRSLTFFLHNHPYDIPWPIDSYNWHSQSESHHFITPELCLWQIPAFLLVPGGIAPARVTFQTTHFIYITCNSASWFSTFKLCCLLLYNPTAAVQWGVFAYLRGQCSC